MARPIKEPHERREARYNLRLTLAEKTYVETQARAAGLDPSEYLRRRALGHQVPPAPSRADASLITELNRLGLELNAIGNNVNQVARAANTGRSTLISLEKLHDRLEETRAEVDQLLERVALGS